MGNNDDDDDDDDDNTHEKLLDSDWLRAVQFKCNTSAKSVTPVQKV